MRSKNIQYFKMCPVCGNNMMTLDFGNDTKVSICSNTACKVVIENNEITVADDDEYLKLRANASTDLKPDTNTFMLLKADLSKPMLIKNTNKFDEKCRNTYCIVQANDIEDAISQFSRKFDVIKITKDMVVPIKIKEL